MLKFKKMGSDKVPLLLVTANVGSIFEDPSAMLPIWTSEFLQAVSRMDPKFIALHLQEVGGKAYEKSMQYVKDFVQRLFDCPELRLYDKIRVYLDEDFSSPENFTALGNMYFAHSSLTDLKIWDFDVRTYIDVVGKEVHSGNIEKITTKEKAKFPQHFFPECKWSRKGFLRTRWMIRGTAVEFVNIHLFHDASNLVAMEPFPSVYCRSRRRALHHTVKHLHADADAAPYFMFGDFNFRTDTAGVVKKVTEDLSACRLQNGGNVESSKLHYKSKDDRVVLTVGKKEFSHVDHQNIFREPWLQRYDRELDALRPHLYEFPVKFPPTYPFEENVLLPTHYMKTRCPSWCDRVLVSAAARALLDARLQERHSASRKSVADSTDSSGRVSSSDSSPARSGSPALQSSPGKSLEKKLSVLEVDALMVPGIAVSRKSIADPTSVQHALNSRVNSVCGSRRRLVRNQSEGSPREVPPPRRADYGTIGDSACMGDHKPVYLRVMLQTDRGTVEHPTTPHFPLTRRPTDPDIYATQLKPDQFGSHPTKLDNWFKRIDHRLYRTRTGSLNERIFRIPLVQVTAADTFNYDVFVYDVDNSLLSPKPCLDPYTPESIDSHTPNIDDASSSSENVDTEPSKLSRDHSVSPTQLKSRLDMLLNDKTKCENVPELERLNSRESCKTDTNSKSFCCLALKCYGFCRRRVKCKCLGCTS